MECLLLILKYNLSVGDLKPSSWSASLDACNIYIFLDFFLFIFVYNWKSVNYITVWNTMSCFEISRLLRLNYYFATLRSFLDERNLKLSTPKSNGNKIQKAISDSTWVKDTMQFTVPYRLCHTSIITKLMLYWICNTWSLDHFHENLKILTAKKTTAANT